MKSVTSVLLLTAALAVLFSSACAPGPKYQACRVDGECQKSMGASAYCSLSHCVECVTRATCGDGRLCIDGRCESRMGRRAGSRDSL
jgi:hypothetical protein